jgi:3-hydroxyisobutyrate dehydrogenase
VPGINPNVPSSKEYNGGFACALIKKDLSIALDAARASHASIPLGNQSYQLYDDICSSGFDDFDFKHFFCCDDSYLFGLFQKNI